jgi:DNA-binding MarR family transcriptional regulator
MKTIVINMDQHCLVIRPTGVDVQHRLTVGEETLLRAIAKAGRIDGLYQLAVSLNMDYTHARVTLKRLECRRLVNVSPSNGSHKLFISSAMVVVD